MSKVKIKAAEGSKVIKVFTIDEEGFITNKTGFLQEDFQKSFMVDREKNPPPIAMVLPCWDRAKEVWVEKASEEAVKKNFYEKRNLLLSSFRRAVGMSCYSIASEEEQRNWILWPEDLSEDDISNRKKIKKNREIYKKHKEDILNCKSLDELFSLKTPELIK